MTEALSSADLSSLMESPLVMLGEGARQQLSVDGRDCAVVELPFLDVINLRGNASDAGFSEAVLRVTGLALPLVANSASVVGARQLIWLGPDEWLLKLSPGEGGDMARALREALAGQHVSVVEVGSGYTTLSLQGPGAADLLARGCPLDLHARVFGAGAVAQSHIARAPILLRCVAAGASYEVTVRRSFAPYLFSWLGEAGWA